ncbi:MAG: hypothetical protein AAFQ94_31480 [Bacteroidota bacterium]
MKKKVLIIATVLLLGFTTACQDEYSEISKEDVTEVKSETGDEEQEDVVPGERKPSGSGND